jgi:hypothetical protein
MSDDQKKPPAVSATVPARPKPVSFGFSCGNGPCRTFYVFENEAQPAPPLLPAPPKGD